jgi:hypothetical protein
MRTETITENSEEYSKANLDDPFRFPVHRLSRPFNGSPAARLFQTLLPGYRLSLTHFAGISYLGDAQC